jgi:hypothetical protein
MASNNKGNKGNNQQAATQQATTSNPGATAPATLAGQQGASTVATSTKPPAVALARAPGQAGSKNGVVAKAWAVYNANPAATRSAAVALAVAAGVNKATARTQYQAWYTAAKVAAATPAA